MKNKEFWIKSLEESKKAGDLRDQQENYSSLGEIYYQEGKYVESKKFLEEGLKLSEIDGNFQGAATSHKYIGLCLCELGQYQKSIEHQKNALEIVVNITHDQGEEQNALCNIGHCYFSYGQKLDGFRKERALSNALDFFQKSYFKAHELPNTSIKQENEKNLLLFKSSLNLGLVNDELDNIHQSRKWLQECHTYFEKITKNKQEENYNTLFSALGSCYAHLQEYHIAEKYLKSVIKQSEKNHFLNDHGKCYHDLGHIYTFQNNFSKALHYYKKHYEIAQKTNFRNDEYNVELSENSIKSCNESIQKYDEILELKQQIQLFKDQKNIEEELRCYQEISSLYSSLEQYQMAQKYCILFIEQYPINSFLFNSKTLFNFYDEYGNILLALGREEHYREAIIIYQKALFFSTQYNEMEIDNQESIDCMIISRINICTAKCFLFLLTSDLSLFDGLENFLMKTIELIELNQLDLHLLQCYDLFEEYYLQTNQLEKAKKYTNLLDEIYLQDLKDSSPIVHSPPPIISSSPIPDCSLNLKHHAVIINQPRTQNSHSVPSSDEESIESDGINFSEYDEIPPFLRHRNIYVQNVDSDSEGTIDQWIQSYQTAIDDHQFIEAGNICNLIGRRLQKEGNIKGSIHYHLLDLQIQLDNQRIKNSIYPLNNLGKVYALNNDFKNSIHYAKEHLRVSIELNDNIESQRAHTNLGFAYERWAESDKILSLSYRNKLLNQSLDHYQNSLALAQKLPQVCEERLSMEQDAFFNIGNIYSELECFDLANESYQSSLSLSQNPIEKARIYCSLGLCCHSLQKYEEAKSFHDLDLKYSLDSNDINNIGKAYGNIGNVYFEKKDYFKAKKYYQKWVDSSKKIADIQNLQDAENALSQAKEMINNQEKASAIEEKINKNKNTQSPKIIENYFDLADLFYTLREYNKLYSFCSNILYSNLEFCDFSQIRTFYYYLGFSSQQNKKYSEAIDFFKKELEISKTLYDQMEAQTHLAICYFEEGINYEISIEHFNVALDKAKSIYDMQQEIEILQYLEKINIKFKNDENILLYETALTRLSDQNENSNNNTTDSPLSISLKSRSKKKHKQKNKKVRESRNDHLVQYDEYIFSPIDVDQVDIPKTKLKTKSDHSFKVKFNNFNSNFYILCPHGIENIFTFMSHQIADVFYQKFGLRPIIDNLFSNGLPLNNDEDFGNMINQSIKQNKNDIIEATITGWENNSHIQYYMAECTLSNISPHSFLIKILQEYDNDRGSIILSNHRINSDSLNILIRSLIVDQGFLTILNLSNNYLDDQSIDSFLTVLESSETIASICNTVKALNNLKYLDFSRNSISLSEEKLSSLFCSLSRHLFNLEYIDFSYSNFNDTNISAFSSFVVNSQKLTTIKLASCLIGTNNQLGPTIQSSFLVNLDLSYPLFTPFADVSLSLCESLSRCFSLKILNLSGWKLLPTNFGEILSSCPLQTLILQNTLNQIVEYIQPLFHSNSLQSLDIGHNFLQTPSFFTLLSNLQRSKIMELKIDENKITDTNIYFLLLSVIQNHSILTHMSLCGCFYDTHFSVDYKDFFHYLSNVTITCFSNEELKNFINNFFITRLSYLTLKLCFVTSIKTTILQYQKDHPDIIIQHDHPFIYLEKSISQETQ